MTFWLLSKSYQEFCSYQEKLTLDNHLSSIFAIYYHEDPPSCGGVRRVSPIPPQYTLAIYYCLSKLYDLKFCVTEWIA